MTSEQHDNQELNDQELDGTIHAIRSQSIPEAPPAVVQQQVVELGKTNISLAANRSDHLIGFAKCLIQAATVATVLCIVTNVGWSKFTRDSTEVARLVDQRPEPAV